jgi:hypothetical protein
MFQYFEKETSPRKTEKTMRQGALRSGIDSFNTLEGHDPHERQESERMVSGIRKEKDSKRVNKP